MLSANLLSQFDGIGRRGPFEPFDARGSMKRPLKLSGLVLALALASPGARAADPALEAAMKLCDEQAGTPLSGIAGVADIYMRDMFESFAGRAWKLDKARFLPVYGACSASAGAKDAHPRFRYQQARLEAFEGYLDTRSKSKPAGSLRVIEDYAGRSWPDARFMLARLGSWAEPDAAPARLAVFKAALLDAADQGHIEALDDAAWHLARPGFGYFDPGEGDVVRAAGYFARLAEGAPPPPHTESKDWKAWVRYSAVINRAMLVAAEAAFGEDEKRAAFALFKAWAEAGDPRGKLEYAKSLELGRSTAKDPAAAIALYEELRTRTDEGEVGGVAGAAAVRLANMLMSGAADGKADPARARLVLEEAVASGATVAGQTKVLLAALLSEGEYFAREPQKALELLEPDVYDTETCIMLARLIIRTEYSIKSAETFIKTLEHAAIKINRKDAAMALGLLAAKGGHPFDKAPEAIRALAHHAKDDLDTRLLLARITQVNLASSSFKPFLAPDSPLKEADILAAIAEGETAGKPDALLLKSMMLRKGWMMPQDDRTATKLLFKAAEMGNEEAMVLAADAYRDGPGVKKNPKEAVKLWRAAARKGNLAAREAIVSYFAFFKEISLAEGIGGTMALFANGEGFRFGDRVIPSGAKLAGAFVNGRILQSSLAEVAAAALNGFRHAPASLEEEPMLAIAKALPEEARAAIETALKAEGFYGGEPEGYFDPPVREALRAYVKAKGPLLSLAP
jgi:TPR repeat protein